MRTSSWRNIRERNFKDEVVRTAEAIDLATRTLLTEVDVPNKSGLLLPGGYAQVHLQIHVQGERLQVPVNALLFRSEGLRAVVIDCESPRAAAGAGHRARLRNITGSVDGAEGGRLDRAESSRLH